MFPRVSVLAFLVFFSAAEDVKNFKRSISNFVLPSYNSLIAHPWASQYHWQLHPAVQGLYQISTPYSGKTGHLSLGPSTTHDVAAAVAAAKEATTVAALAHQRVQAAKEQVIIQERIAAAKEAAAQAAIQRSEAAAQIVAAIQKSEALAAAAAAVQKSTAVNAASANAAVHPVAHFTSVPWISTKPVFHHWG